MDTAQQLIYRERAESSDLGWVEWQANEFAMAMVLPRIYLEKLVAARQDELGIKRNIGTIFINSHHESIRHCENIVAHIACLFKVNNDLIMKRLKYLGILNDCRKRHPSKFVGEALDDFSEL